MTDKHDIKSEIIEIKGALQKVYPHHDLIKAKANKLLMAILLGLMTLFLVVGIAITPDNKLKPKSVAPTAYTTDMNPVLSTEINSLKGQFVGLISGSIESKLKTLENNIRQGAVANSLGTIEDLKNDVRVLRAYSNPATASNVSVSNEQLIQEVSHLKTLIYLTLSSCGLMLAAVAGIWFKNQRKLPHKKKTVTYYLGKH